MRVLGLGSGHYRALGGTKAASQPRNSKGQRERRTLGLLLVATRLAGLIAGLLSVPVVIGIAATLVYVLYKRWFGWSMDLRVDPLIVAQGVALAVGAAPWPGSSTPPAGPPPGAHRPRSCAMTERRLARS